MDDETLGARLQDSGADGGPGPRDGAPAPVPRASDAVAPDAVAPDARTRRAFGSLSAQTLPRQVARALVGSMLLGHFKPGDPLPAAADLAREFEVSRPVVREALKIVATLGMVTSRQGRYSRVADRGAWNDLSAELLAARLEVGALDDIMADSLESCGG